MSRTAILCLSFALSLAAAAAYPADVAPEAVVPRTTHDTLFDEPVVRRTCRQLLQKARFGFSDIEFAAFIVRDSDGNLSSVAWAPSVPPNPSRWSGNFPPGAVAIVHTHPNAIPDPSHVDVHTAKTSRLPVYVITRSLITATDGERTRVVAKGEWQAGAVAAAAGADQPGR